MAASKVSKAAQAAQVDAAGVISRMLHDETGHYIAPSRLKRFIQQNWSVLSAMAHTIHDEGKPDGE